MKDITVTKQKLIDTLRANREKHATEYAELAEAFKAQAHKDLVAAATAVEGGADPMKYHYFSWDTPEDHRADYDRAIALLDWDESGVISLSQNDFNRYVLDVWEWSGKFAETKMSYGR